MKKTIMSVALMSAISLAQANVEVSDCIIQEVIPSKNMTGAFMTLDNQSQESVDIVGAELPSITHTVELHEMKVVDNIMRMQQIPFYRLTPGVHKFKKGGYHVMLMNIEHKPQVGEQHQLTLNLSNGETISCEAKVLSIDEVMARFKAEQNVEQQNMSDHQSGAMSGFHHSVDEMNSHHQSGAMSDSHHSVDEMNSHHQSGGISGSHHSVDEMNFHHQSGAMSDSHHSVEEMDSYHQ